VPCPVASPGTTMPGSGSTVEETLISRARSAHPIDNASVAIATAAKIAANPETRDPGMVFVN